MLVALLVLAGFFALPLTAHYILLPRMNEKLNGNLAVESIHTNPFTATLRLKKVQLNTTGGEEVAALQEVVVDLEGFSSVFSEGWVLNEVTLDKPRLNVDVEPGGVNIAQVLEPLFQGEDKRDKPQQDELPRVRIAAIGIRDAELSFRDGTRSPAFEKTIRQFSLRLENFDTQPEEGNPYMLGLETAAGETLSWEGTFVPQPLVADGTIVLRAFQPASYVPLFHDQVAFDIAESSLDFSLSYDLRPLAQEPVLRVMDGRLTLNNLQLRDRDTGDIFHSIDTLRLEGVSADLLAATGTIDSLTAEGGHFLIQRNQEGEVNLARYFVPPDEGDNTQNTDGAPDATAQARKQGPPPNAQSLSAALEAIEAQLADAPNSRWTFQLNQLELTDYSVVWEDRSLAEPLQYAVDGLSLRGENLTNATDAEFPLQLKGKLPEEGTLSAQAKVRPGEAAATLDYTMQSLALPPLASYINTLGLRLESGTGHSEGTLDLAFPPEAPPQFTLRGAVGLDSIDCRYAETDESLLGWSQVRAEELALRFPERRLSLQALVLLEPTLDFYVRPDGQLSFMQLMGEDKDTGEPKEEQSAWQVVLDDLKIEQGTLHFADRRFDPPYATTVTQLNADVRNLATIDDGKPITVDLSAVIDKASKLTLAGTTSPFAASPSSDFKGRLESFTLAGLSSYSSQFIGYPVESGQLNLDVEYTLKGSHLEGTNQISLKDFNLGAQSNPSPLVQAPVKLAVSLLKGPGGDISLDVPVSGDIDSPDFRVSGLFVKTITNVISRVATAPFSLLAGIVGANAEELERHRFSPGSTDVGEGNTQALDQLVQALQKRPALTLELRGSVDNTADAEALREQLYRSRMVELARANDAIDTSDASTDEAFRAIPEDERRDLLEALYWKARAREAGVPEPDRGPDILLLGDLIGELTEEDTGPLETDEFFQGQAPDECTDQPEPVEKRQERLEEAETPSLTAMREYVRSRIALSSEKLEELARKRAEVVRDWLVKNGVAQERLTIGPPATDAEEAGVQFHVK